MKFLLCFFEQVCYLWIDQNHESPHVINLLLLFLGMIKRQILKVENCNYMNLKSIILSALMFCCSFHWAQGQGARLYTSADGLPSTQILFMNQDKDGYVWICNYSGLARFDGYGITPYYEMRGKGKLRSNNVYKLLTDNLGQNWIGTERGLHLLNSQTGYFEHIRLQKEEDDNIVRNGLSVAIWDMTFMDGGNKLLVCAGINGFYVVDIRSHKISEPETTKIRLAMQGIVSGRIFVDSKQRLWISANGIYVLDLKTFQQWKAKWPLGYNPSSGYDVRDFIEDKSTHTLLIADACNGVCVFDEDTRQFKKIDGNSSVFQDPQCFLQRKNGTLLVGCEKNGIGEIDLSARKISKCNLKNCAIDLTYSKIHDMIEDRWGNLYLGIYQKGLLVVPESSGGFSYEAIGSRQPVQNRSAITCFAKTPEGQIWVGTDGGGIFHGENFSEMSELPLHHQFNGAVQDIIANKDGRIWLATFGSGLFNYQKGVAQPIQDRKGVINIKASKLQLDTLHGRLYVSTYGSGVNWLDINTLSMGKIQQPLPLYVFALKLDSKGRLWIGSLDCLCYNPSTDRICNFYLQKLNNSAVNTFFEDRKGNMYIGTKNGLFIYDERADSCRHYPLDKTGKPVIVRAIAADKDDKYIWMSTNRGIICLDAKAGNFRTFSWYDIEKAGDFQNSAVMMQDDGTIIFGGDNGIVSFNPSAIEKEKNEPVAIHFGKLYINGEVETFDASAKGNALNAVTEYATRLTLPHYKNSFTISFSPFNYALSSQLRYLYKLEGYESKWHTATADNPQAVYNQLPPGKYKLIVMSFRQEKGGGTSEITMDVIILHPWYWSWWTKLLYSLILITILYFQYRAYVAREKSKKRLRTVMTEYLRIKENYQNLIQTDEATTDSVNMTIDQKLKDKIITSISKYYSDPKFGVEELSRETGMSRVHLYRRTKDLFNCSPNELLRSVRMKKAGLMLIKEKMSVSDVAFEVGFSDPSYFSTSFKRYFNISPKDFVTRYRDTEVEDAIKQLFEL